MAVAVKVLVAFNKVLGILACWSLGSCCILNDNSNWLQSFGILCLGIAAVSTSIAITFIDIYNSEF